MFISTADASQNNRIVRIYNSRDLISRLAIYEVAVAMSIGIAALCTLWLGDLPITYGISQSPWILAHKDGIRQLSESAKYMFYVVFILVLIHGWWRQHSQQVQICLAYLWAQCLGSIFVVRILKMLTGHARPQEALMDGRLADIWIGPTWDSAYHSFPSGHTADLFTSAVFASLLVKNLWIRALLILFAVFMGFTRVALAKHFPSDVIFGAMIGAGASLIVAYFWLLPRVRSAAAGSSTYRGLQAW